MTEFEQTLQYVQSLPLQNKINVVIQDFLTILPALKKRDPSNDGATLVRTILASAVAADGSLTKEEIEMIKAVCKAVGIRAPITKKGAFDFVNLHSGPAAYTTVQALSSIMTEEERRHLFSAVLALSAADGQISEHEAGYICSLLEEPDLF